MPLDSRKRPCRILLSAGGNLGGRKLAKLKTIKSRKELQRASSRSVGYPLYTQCSSWAGFQAASAAIWVPAVEGALSSALSSTLVSTPRVGVFVFSFLELVSLFLKLFPLITLCWRMSINPALKKLRIWFVGESVLFYSHLRLEWGGWWLFLSLCSIFRALVMCAWVSFPRSMDRFRCPFSSWIKLGFQIRSCCRDQTSFRRNGSSVP